MRIGQLTAALICLLLLPDLQVAQVSGKRSRLAGQVKSNSVVYTESHAMVIGISDYTHWKPLPGVDEDIPAVADLFKSIGFKVETPKISSRTEFKKTLDNFISQYGMNQNNRLVIYFAGHGYTETRPEGVQVGSIVMKDAPKDPSVPGFDLSLVTMDELNADAIRIKAKHVLFIFDSCFAGTIFMRSRSSAGSAKAPPLILEKASAPVRQFITSGTAAQEVPDRSDFRILLQAGLRDRAADFYPKDGFVTGEELGRYLAGEVASVSKGRQTPEYGKIREPRLARGDMVFELPAMEAGKSETPEEVDCHLAWKEIENSRIVNALESFLKDCGESKQAKAARLRLIVIRDEERKIVEPTRETEETETWKIVAATKDPEELRKFIKQYPEGSYKKPAEYRLRQLEAEIARIEADRKSLLATTRGAFTSGTIVNGKLIRKQGECEVYTEDLGNGVRLEMVKVRGGRFRMGAPNGELGRDSDEGPLREVTIRGYLMGKYEVTQGMWREVAGYPQVGRELNPDPSGFKGEDRPVENVSWEEVKEFIARLNSRLGLREGEGYRLPSEAEWEYAARAGTVTPFGFGETIDAEIVNYNGNYPYGKGKKGQYRKGTVTVGSLGVANGWGLYDMQGNVWEWCEDEYHSNYDGAPVDGGAWVSSALAALRVIRGGSWDYGAVLCRSAYRSRLTPGYRDYGLGFRLSRTLP